MNTGQIATVTAGPIADLNRRLAAQNSGEAFVDCNAAGRAHRWVPTHGAWHRCTRCPVATRTTGRPRPYLAPTPQEVSA